MNEGKRDEAWWSAHHAEEGWQVKWGFDSGDCFAVFPLLPKLPGEGDADRWSRSFIPLRDADEMLCIESDVVEVLLRRVLETRFDPSLDHGRDEVFPGCPPHFDWYFDNVYTVETCRGICSLLRSAAESLAGFPNDVPVCVTGAGDVATCRPSDDGWARPLAAADARRDCLLIAEYLERVASSAERQGATVTFSGP